MNMLAIDCVDRDRLDFDDLMKLQEWEMRLMSDIGRRGIMPGPFKLRLGPTGLRALRELVKNGWVEELKDPWGYRLVNRGR